MNRKGDKRRVGIVYGSPDFNIIEEFDGKKWVRLSPEDSAIIIKHWNKSPIITKQRWNESLRRMDTR